MAVFKCKMCGGDINLIENCSVAECEYCGSKQTVPLVDDEKKLTLFARANRLRFGCEFDRAAGVYESIVADFPEEAEAYWGLILCKYGIEYVDDPATAKKIPTCHRSSFDSVMDDANFDLVMENSDAVSRAVYREEAKAIEELRKDIIEVSGKEEPYDIFICYKETDESGDRTIDSVIAQDVYDALTEKGYRVFFSRVTLENKLGQEYEPYIFAALNSAKIMLAFGTDYEYYNAVWVKNEWSRFIQLMVKDKSKYLIPCFKGIDAYDMPKEFAKLQSQDMGKVGAIQDLLRGIEKILPKDSKEPTPQQPIVQQVVQANGSTVSSLLERAFMFLEDGDWNSADEYCEKVLDQDPKNAEAYLGKLMAELGVGKRENLKNCKNSFENYNNYQKAVRFGNSQLKSELEGYIAFILDRNELERLNGIYNNAINLMKHSTTEREYKEVADLFKIIIEFKDSEPKRNECIEKAETARKEAIYNNAINLMKAATESEYKEAAELFDKIIEFKDSKNKYNECLEKAEVARKEAIYNYACNKVEINTIASLENAIELYKSILDWKDSNEQMNICNKRLEDLKTEEEARRIHAQRKAEEERIAKERAKKKIKKMSVIVPLIIAIVVVLITITKNIIIPNVKYNNAVKLYEVGKYDEAISVFSEIADVKDSADKIKAIKYDKAMELFESRKNMEALSLFVEMQDYKDSKEKISLINRTSFSKTAISAGFRHTVGLKSDGMVVATGKTDNSQCDVYTWRDITAISTGKNHTVGLKSNGTVVAVGNNDDGQCKVLSWKDIVAISAGYRHTVGLKSDGTVVVVGYNYFNQGDVSEWKDIVAVSAGASHTVGLKSDGTVGAVGNNCDAQCNVSDWTDIVAISAGDYHTVGLKSDGTVIAVGYNHFGQCDVSDWTDIVAISAGYNHTVGLKSDGTVVAVGDSVDGQCNVSAWKDIIAVSAGDSYTVGLKSDGTVVAVGFNENGQCNVGDWKNIKTPKTK